MLKFIFNLFFIRIEGILMMPVELFTRAQQYFLGAVFSVHCVPQCFKGCGVHGPLAQPPKQISKSNPHRRLQLQPGHHHFPSHVHPPLRPHESSLRSASQQRIFPGAQLFVTSPLACARPDPFPPDDDDDDLFCDRLTRPVHLADAIASIYLKTISEPRRARVISSTPAD